MRRYSRRPFPAYRHRPGETPHPERHPEGHSRGRVEPDPVPLTEEGWSDNADYLFGIDLFNAEYWWEAHEAWERLWHLESPETPTALLLQGLIQLAAARLKEDQGERRGVEKLTRSALAKLRSLPDVDMGINLRSIRETTRRLDLVGM